MADNQPNPPKKPWEPMRLDYLGSVRDLVQSGTGKRSVNSPDGPDTKKPPGQ